jgi:hypothetical protein
MAHDDRGSVRNCATNMMLLRGSKVAYDMAASVDRDECETMLGSDLDCCLDVTGYE